MFQKNLLLNHSLCILTCSHKSCAESHRLPFSSCGDLSIVRTGHLASLSFLIPTDILFLDLKILHGLPIRSHWKAVQLLSSGVCLKVSSSSGGVPSCIQRGSSFHLSRKFWFWTACVTLSSLNHLAYFGLETLVCNAVYSYLCVWGLCGSAWNRSCHTAKDVSTLFCFLGE